MPGVADHPLAKEMEDLWNQGFRATGILSILTGDYPAQAASLPSASSLGRYGQRYWLMSDQRSSLLDDQTDPPEDDLVDLMNRIESKIGKVRSVSLGYSESSSGTSSSRRSFSVIPGSSEPSIRLADKPDVKVRFDVQKGKGFKKAEGWNLGVFLPDMQIGYWADTQGNLETTHDENAISIAHNIMADLQRQYGVDLVVNAGDTLDFPAFSSHRSGPGFWHTTQLSINRAAEEAAIERQLAPDAEIIWFSGNHDSRITNYLVDKSPMLAGLTRADEKVPVNSVRHLCRLDEYGVKFLEPYPDAEFWANEHLRFEHGSLYSATPGGTAAKYLKTGISVGYGHVHRQEILFETRHTKSGPRTHFAGSPGCLCRLDGGVPSAKTGITSEGKQAARRAENWQNGLWVFWYQPGKDQLVAVEPISIWGNWAMWRGREYAA